MAEQKKRAMAGPDRSSKRRKVGFEATLLALHFEKSIEILFLFLLGNFLTYRCTELS